MLTEAQKQELVALAQSLESQGKSQQEVQAAIDSKKAEMLGDNTVKEATEVEPIAVEKQDSVAGKVPYSINNQEVTKEEFDNYTANEQQAPKELSNEEKKKITICGFSKSTAQ